MLLNMIQTQVQNNKTCNNKMHIISLINKTRLYVDNIRELIGLLYTDRPIEEIITV